MSVNYAVKKAIKIFENLFLKNGKLEFWSKALIASIEKYSSNENLVHYQKMIFTKIASFEI